MDRNVRNRTLMSGVALLGDLAHSPYDAICEKLRFFRRNALVRFVALNGDKSILVRCVLALLVGKSAMGYSSEVIQAREPRSVAVRNRPWKHRNVEKLSSQGE
jgi:hypothetical protein